MIQLAQPYAAQHLFFEREQQRLAFDVDVSPLFGDGQGVHVSSRSHWSLVISH